jgi:hypothetical protein
LIGRVQAHLESIYALETGLSATEFLVDPEAAQLLGASGHTTEELLILQQGDELELALYLCPQMLKQLEALSHAPGDRVVDQALDSYCQVAEGVSHFLYVAHAAQQDRRVSLLEVEAQAEVDKFATCVLYGWRRGAAWAETLLQRLFAWVSYRPHLSAEARYRYEEANRLGLTFCRRLLKHVAQGRMDRFLSELRYAYRLGAEAKLRHLGQPA